MSRILFVSAAIFPSATFAHVGHHDFGATDTLLHSVSQSNHALTLLGALTLPIAAIVLIWKRRK